MIITIKKSKLYEWIIPILLLLPYLDRGWIRNTFLYKENGVYIYPMMFMMIVIGVLFSLITMDYNIMKTKMKNTLKISQIYAISVLVYGFVMGIQKNNVLIFAVQFAWLFLPIWYAYKIYIFIDYKKLNWGNIIDKYIILFVLYCIATIMIQIYYYDFRFGFFIRISGGSGSGGLLFSYTVTIVFGLLILRKKFFPFIIRNVMAFILILFTFLSGSRGAIIAVLVEILIYIFTNRKVYQRIIVGMIMTIYILLGEPIKQIYAIAPRLMQLTDNLRFQTLTSTLNVIKEQDILSNLFGNGIGQFFPYQKWLNSINSLYGTVHFKNYIEIKGEIFLIQPHNTYIHLLLESGVIGLCAFCLFLFTLTNKLFKNYSGENKNNILIIFGLICMYNFLDSIFSMAPGIASIWWIIIFIIVNYEEERENEKNHVSLRHTS